MKIKFDGKDIEIAGINLNQLCAVEDKFGSLAALRDSGNVPLKLIRFVAYLVIHPVCPDLTEEQIGEKLDMETISEIAKVLNPSANIGADRPLP